MVFQYLSRSKFSRSLGVYRYACIWYPLVEGKEFPVYVKSLFAHFMLGAVEVNAHSDYRIKVGEWEWGDRLEFEPVEMNLAGGLIPIMPVRIASEIYLTLGWTDRANRISDAVRRAHHRLDFGF